MSLIFQNNKRIIVCFTVISIFLILFSVNFVSALIVCNNNLDCDDCDLYTSDVCVNPGTDLSYCDYLSIRCLNNNDCGITGFFGAEFCSGNDVFKIFQNSVCESPGTTSSSCKVTNSSLLVVDCGDNYCDSFENDYCKGNDVYHSRWCYTTGCEAGICYNNQASDEQLVRTCINGCENGKCINQPVCNINSDCGTDVLLNQLSCKDNNVFDKKLINTCNNPGTLDSFCSVSYLDVLVQTCTNGCSNNQCIIPPTICSKNSDCNFNQFCEFPSCSAQQGLCLNTPEVCFTIYQPVCGCDGKTYSNDCFRKIAKVSKSYDGECASIICLINSDCGKSKTEYVCDGKDIKKIKTVPECVSGSCESKTTEEFVRTCAQGCSNGVCKGDGHNYPREQEEEPAPEIIKPKIIEITEVADSHLNETIKLNAIQKLQTNMNFSFGSYFWLILLLVFVFIILIIILILILAR